ncbi:MAG: hypothetical protein QF915_05950 [Candidatus Woesearchaeota archaeon]|jgi:thiol-disulfide isomerase/thioredoxin|nr:hypothetical protein [Candidatus Woesearchaeota archaeon]MDP7457898.1 hypothetical protein [Candidatus Woesearchaeota archaeon]
MNKKIILTLILGIFIVACAPKIDLDSNEAKLATCLTEKGATFFGAYWCGHCKAQKEMFGDAVNLLPYVECSLPERAGQTQVCKDEDIQSYPTWKVNGEVVTGTQSLGQLATLSGCNE